MFCLPYTKAGYDLLHTGARALARVEAAGFRMDTDYLARAESKTKRRIRRLSAELEDTDFGRQWRDKYGKKTKYGSPAQLADMLYNVRGYTPIGETDTGALRTDEAALSAIDDPGVAILLQLKKQEKALSTYIHGLQREIVDGYLHPFFNLHLVKTFRSSSDSPNFQNIPVRNKVIKKLVRTAFIPRPGRRIVEIDYKAIEVAIAACYHLDPVMLAYINDASKDMHRDTAMLCFLLDISQMTSEIRHAGKNSFVFPQFYGDIYTNCAANLWKACVTNNLKTAQGVLVIDHLKSMGIKELGLCDPRIPAKSGTFEKHIQTVQDKFWNEMFPVYTDWKRRWWNQYVQKGYYKTHTGFICQGVMRRNEVINYAVQGSAFHCLLKSLCEIVLKELHRMKFKALVVGQIHDSIVCDVPDNELHDFLRMANRVMTQRIREIWPWIITPLVIEADVTAVDAPWATKEPFKFHA